MSVPAASPRAVPHTPGDAEATLREAASRARDHAYAPYSKFRVGAAMLGADGSMAASCNVENASFGACLCAERGALAELVVRGVRQLELLVIVTDATEPTPPCGICRQMLAEFSPRLRVVSFAATGAVARWTLDQLMPSPFTPESLHHV